MFTVLPMSHRMLEPSWKETIYTNAPGLNVTESRTYTCITHTRVRSGLCVCVVLDKSVLQER